MTSDRVSSTRNVMEYRYYPLPEDRLEPIEEMAQGIASAGNEREVFRSLFLFATRTTPATAIFVSLYAPQTGLRRCVYAAEVISGEDGNDTLEEDEDPSTYPELPLNDSPPNRAIRTGEVINTPDLVAALTGLPRMASGSDAGEKLPKSALTVPLGIESRTVGAFQVQSLSPRACPGRQDDDTRPSLTAPCLEKRLSGPFLVRAHVQVFRN